MSAFANTWWVLGSIDLNFYDPPRGTNLLIEDTVLNAVKAVGIGRAAFMKQKTGGFKPLKSKAGFVLAGMDGIRYRQYELQMQSGDQLFLYTDGVTEAMNPEES